ncbi:MAG: DNA repair protein RecO [Fibrobacter sp.]|nr:DNA repair protein RecO [Fibrobacter sp.]
MLIKTRCIVLHRFPYSDSSFIVKALTEESGVISFILKGGKRKESPFKGALDPLALSEVVFRQNPQKSSGDGLLFVKEATLLDWHGNMRNDLMSTAVAQVMAEIVMRYAPPGVPLQEEFALLNRALEELERAHSSDQTSTDAAANGTGTSANNVFAQWLLDTCDLWGYHLDLGTCSRCERSLEEPPADFHPESGGLICRACQGVDTPRARIQTTAGLWALRSRQDIGESRVFVENALLAYLRNHIGFLKEIHSLQWLQEIRKLCSAQTT